MAFVESRVTLHVFPSTRTSIVVNLVLLFSMFFMHQLYLIYGTLPFTVLIHCSVQLNKSLCKFPFKKCSIIFNGRQKYRCAAFCSCSLFLNYIL